MGPHGAPWGPTGPLGLPWGPWGPKPDWAEGSPENPFSEIEFSAENSNWGSKIVEKKVEIEGAGLSRRDPARNSVSGGGVDVENGEMATHLVPNWGDLGSVGVPAPARTPLGPKRDPIFRQKVLKS